jgi:putative transposase
MAHSFACNLAHIIFSTKGRAPVLTVSIRSELYKYMAAVMSEIQATPVIINGTENHIHIFAYLPRDLAPSDVVEKTKTGTSKWLKKRFPELGEFYWQPGYGCFSVSMSNADSVREYIAGQENHHKKMTFEDEFRALLKKHGIEFDEKYIWE